jgi:ligand-binding sensor domain-containing protein
MVEGRFRNYTTADGLSSDRVTSVFQDRGGGIWAGTASGVDHLVGQRFVPIQPGPETGNVPYGPLREDSTGKLYALSLANGISRIDGGRLIHLSNAIEASGMVESDDRDLWFSGRNGVFRVATGELKRQESDHDSPLDVTTVVTVMRVESIMLPAKKLTLRFDSTRTASSCRRPMDPSLACWKN